MTPDAVGTFLKEHPEFFEQYADLLADIYIPHPHGGRAIPISERQILTLRERCKHLETKLREVMQYGEENDAIGEKVHRLALALLAAQDFATVTAAVVFNLREDFAVPHVELRVWPKDGDTPGPEVPEASGALKEYVAALAQPYCGAHVPEALVTEVFGEPAPLLKSFSMIALRSSEVFGVLALASEDPQRFYPEMGTVYLRRIGELSGAALTRHLPV
jgi:uncharacterized protein YigA (DUF484 family)